MIRFTKFRQLLLWVLLGLFSSLPGTLLAQGATQIEAAKVSADGGERVSIPVSFQSDKEVVAAQFDLSFDVLALVPELSTGGNALNDHDLDYEEIAPGVLRVVVTTDSLSVLDTGSLVNIGLRVSLDALPGDYPLELDNVVFSDAQGEQVSPVVLEDGRVTIYNESLTGIPTMSLPGYLVLAVLMLGLGWVFLRQGAQGVMLSLMLGCVLFTSVLRAVTLPGDANDDGAIDAQDIPVIVTQILERQNAPGDPDCNEDNKVDVLDTVCVAGFSNHPPIIEEIPDQTTPVDELFETTAKADDPDLPDDVLTFSLDTKPSGMTIDPDTGLIEWTPDSDQLGDHSVTVRVSDEGGLFDTTSFVITVETPENQPPTIEALSNVSVQAEELLEIAAIADDPDLPDDVLSFSLDVSPVGMSIDPVSGLISWTPTDGQLGNHDVTVRVTDEGGLFDTGSFIVSVQDAPNQPPTIDPISDAEAVENAPFGLTATADDPDLPDDTLSFSLDVAPTGMAIDPDTGLISWTPGSDQLAQHNVTVRVTDAGALFASTSFKVTVSPEPNRSPTISPIGDATIGDGVLFQVTAVASDPDLPDDSLTFSLDVAPPGMTIDPVAGLISWMPAVEQVGSNPVTVRVTDAEGLFATTSFTVTVTESAVNLAPTLQSPGNRVIRANALFKANLFATDPNPGDTLTFSLPTAPAGLSVDPTSGLMSWTPGTGDLGDNPVTARVNDAGGLMDEKSFTIKVVPEVNEPVANRAPVLTVPADSQTVWGNTLNLSATATDPDAGDILTFTFANSPSGMTINSGSGAIGWTPQESQVGFHDVVVKVTDPHGGVDFGSFTVTVKDVNKAPTAVDDLFDARVGETLNVSPPGVMENDADPNDDPLSAELLTQPQNGELTFTSDGSFSYTPNTPATQNILQSVDLTRYASIGVEASDFYSSTWPPERIADQNLETSWFTASTPSIPPWIQVMFDDPGVLVREVRIFGNRESSSGRDFIRGFVSLLDDNGDELWNSGEFDLPAPVRDIVVEVDPPVAGVYATRFTGVDWEMSPAHAGMSEMEVIGDAMVTGLAPTLEWWWSETLVEPNFNNISAAVVVCDLEGDGPAEIIVPTFDSSEVTAILRAFHGDTGAEIFAYTDIRVLAPSQPLCGDIDGDGRPEIVAIIPDGTLLALEHDGTFKWQSEDSGSLTGWDSPAAALADLDGDGSPEIIVGRRSGITVLDNTGTIVWTASGGVGYVRGGIPSVADIDLDGSPEIIGGNTAYRADGTVWWTNGSVPDGGNGIGNFDDDPYAEIVVVDKDVYLLEHDGTLKWGPTPIPGGGEGGPPTVADFDGDGQPEIGVAGATRYAVFETDGTLLWQVLVDDSSSNTTGSTVFDFENDGIAEVVYRDEGFLWIFRGTDGAPLFQERLASGTWVEYPVVADVDNDGRAEIIVGANDESSGFNLPEHGLYVFGASNWVRARPIWNQHTYHVTNVLADGTVPAVEQLNWLTPGLNNFRENDFLPDEVERADSFTYRVSDGGLMSAPARVYVDIHPPNTAPEIISLPRTTGTAGFVYLYAVGAVDVDSDPLVFSVTGPPGMTIDPATGLIRWTPAAAGDVEVVAVVEDDDGAVSFQIFTIVVVDPVNVPLVIGLDPSSAETAIIGATLSPGSVTDAFDIATAAGLVARQHPPAGTVAEPGTPVNIVISLGPAPEDVDDDEDGFTENEGDCNDADNTIFPGATDIPGDGIDQDCDGNDASLPVASVVIQPGVSDVLTNQPVVHTAYGIFADGTSQKITNTATWTNGPTFVSATAGSFIVTASKDAGSGNATVNVHARVAGDLVPPTAIITSPESVDTITEPVDIIGTASDANFFKYELAYAVAGSDEYTLFASSTSPVSGGVLGEFDPTLLINGLYTLRLKVLDAAGNQSLSEITVQLDGFLKVGLFTMSITDSSLPASGLPLELLRTYDSRDRTKGDFGIGWTLGLKSASLSCVDNLGQDWVVVKAGLSWNILPNRAHACVVQIPGERAEVFDFVPAPSISPIVPFSLLSGSFVPRPGTRGTLTDPDGINLAIVSPQPGPAQLLNDNDFSLYAPDRLRYKRPDGMVLEFAEGELHKIIDPVGNAITFSDGGLTHSNGRGFTFSRDTDGRITSISDPMGNIQEYKYSAAGDLASHVDAMGNVTRYFYNQHHGLLRIEDPFNRPVLRNDYDDEGRLVSTLEPDGRLITFDYSSGGQQQTITESDGSVSVVNSDAQGNITNILDALGGQVLQTFDAQGNLLSRTDENGNTTTWTWDGKGNKLTETDALGHTQTFTYDALGNVTSDTDELGRPTTFAYTSKGLASSRTNALGFVDASLTWDGKGNLLTRSDALGNTEIYTYNAFGDPTSVTDARGNQATYSYDANGALLSKTDKFGQTTTFTRNANGDLLSQTDPLGRTTQFEYDAAGNLIRTTDPSGAVQEKQYDSEGNLTGITDPLGQSVQFEYSLQDNLTRRVSPGGLEFVYEYDSLDRQTRVKSPGGQDVTIDYNAAGNVVSQEDVLGNAFQVSWDAGDRPDEMTGPDGTTVERVYDAVGNLLQQTDALGRTTSFEYDALNRLTRTIFADGSDERLAYDTTNNVIQKIDPAGAVTGYAYDGNNNLVKVTEPLGGETLFEYDANDRMVAIEDARGNRTLIEYDVAGQLTRKVYPDGTTEESQYDAAGRVISTTDPDGDVTQYSYDSKGRLVSKTYADASVEAFDWNADDRLIEASNADGTVAYQYNAEGLLSMLVNPDGSSIDYSYDAKGQVTSITTRTGLAVPARTTQLEYDSFGRLIRVEDPDGAITNYSFDAMSNLLSASYPNGTQSLYQYDSLNRVVQITHSNGGGDLEQFSYVLDVQGNRTQVTMLDGSYIEYEYDNQGRLLRESHFDAVAVRQFERSYEYDAVGNRIRSVDLAGQETLYSYNEADQLLNAGSTVFTWGADGNLSSRTDPTGSTFYEFDARNRLIEVQQALDLVNFGYDARGELVSRSINGTEDNFLVGIAPPGQPTQILVEYDSAGNALAENLFGNRQISRQQGGAKSYLHIDASLNVRQLTDATGTISDSYSYDAFGNILTEAGTSNNPYRFAGERMGQVEGLTYLRARYYEPESGLFISRDPFAGVPEVPVTLHRYTYGFQNPVTYSDPSGELSLASVVTAVTIIGLVVGIGVNYLTDVKSTAKEFKGLTDQFRAKFCRGGLLGEGAAIADQTVLIAENEKDLRPSGPTSANYNVFAFGWGWGIGTFGSNSGGEEEFEAPGTRNITQFEGTGKLYTGGYSIGAGGYGAAGVAGEAHFLPEGSEIPITSTGQAGHAAGTAGAAAVSLTTFWTLQGKNNALGWNGALDCYRKPSK